MITPEEKWNQALELTLPIVSTGVGVLSLALTFIALRSQLAQRVYYENGQYFVSVRYPGQRHELRDFVQPSNPDVLAVYSQIGLDPWDLYNFVCQEISYRYDIGEFWQTPSETLARGYGDCEDTSVLLTSLIRAGGVPNCYVVLGSLRGYGHAWCLLNGQILETTFVSARPVPDPEHYLAYCLFNDRQVEELWHGALGEVFSLQRNEALKPNFIAKTRLAECSPESKKQ